MKQWLEDDEDERNIAAKEEQQSKILFNKKSHEEYVKEMTRRDLVKTIKKNKEVKNEALKQQEIEKKIKEDSTKAFDDWYVFYLLYFSHYFLYLLI